MKQPNHISTPQFSLHNTVLAGVLAVRFLTTFAHASDWIGTNANWSSNTNPGWNGSGVPNAVGAVANFGNSNTGVTTQDITAGVTVGTISLTNTGNLNRKITLANAIILNQDGSGTGSATISNSNPNTGTSNYLLLQGGTLNLADDLLISNTSGSTNSAGTNGALGFASDSIIAGTGNITIFNVSNDTSNMTGMIRFNGGTNTFAGNVNIQKGLTTFNNNSSFGSAASNVITLGASGQGSASLLATAGVSVTNNLVVASGTGGTTILGGTSSANVTYNGTVTLNGDLSLWSASTGGTSPNLNSTLLSGVVSGSGALTKIGSGLGRLNGSNTFTGDTRIVAGSLEISNSLALQNSTLDLNTNDAGSLGFRTVTLATLGGLKGTRDLALTNTASTPVALTIANNTGTYIYSGNLSGVGSVSKVGNGTLMLANANSYSGSTSANGGVLNAAAAGALGGTSGVAINSGGTLLLSNSATNDRINNSASVTFAGGTFNLGGVSEGSAGSGGVGALTLTNTSTLDFGTLGTGNLIQFAMVGTHAANTILNVIDWEGTLNADSGTDRLLFAGASSTFTNVFTQSQVTFNGGMGYGIKDFGTYFEVFGVTAVPEPSTWVGAGLLVAAIGWSQRRRFAPGSKIDQLATL